MFAPVSLPLRPEKGCNFNYRAIAVRSHLMGSELVSRKADDGWVIEIPDETARAVKASPWPN